MAAPTITWRSCAGSAGSVAYSSILSLDFGTVTAGAYSNWKVVRPKVTVNSIQSCKWWLSDTAAVRSGAAASIGTANDWYHGYTMNASAPAVCSATKATAAARGAASPETSGSAASYAAVAPNSYGQFIGLCLKVASAAGDGATTAWGQLMRPIHRAICVLYSVKFGEPSKLGIPSEASKEERVETRRQMPFWGKGIVQTTNALFMRGSESYSGFVSA